MEGIIFHTLKGIRGWSKLNISTIDVYKIKDIYYNKRLFCIFDRNYPYTLIIKYNEPQESINLAPGINFKGGVTLSLVNNMCLISDITKRYKTEIEVKNEIEEINIKQKKIELLKKHFENQINDKYFNYYF